MNTKSYKWSIIDHCNSKGRRIISCYAVIHSVSEIIWQLQWYLFQILPVLVFFSALIEVLYHVGAMQIVISAIAALLQLTMKTTPIESFATAAHIFIGQVVARFRG